MQGVDLRSVVKHCFDSLPSWDRKGEVEEVVGRVWKEFVSLEWSSDLESCKPSKTILRKPFRKKVVDRICDTHFGVVIQEIMTKEDFGLFDLLKEKPAKERVFLLEDIYAFYERNIECIRDLDALPERRLLIELEEDLSSYSHRNNLSVVFSWNPEEREKILGLFKRHNNIPFHKVMTTFKGWGYDDIEWLVKWVIPGIYGFHSQDRVIQMTACFIDAKDSVPTPYEIFAIVEFCWERDYFEVLLGRLRVLDGDKRRPSFDVMRKMIRLWPDASRFKLLNIYREFDLAEVFYHVVKFRDICDEYFFIQFAKCIHAIPEDQREGRVNEAHQRMQECLQVVEKGKLRDECLGLLWSEVE